MKNRSIEVAIISDRNATVAEAVLVDESAFWAQPDSEATGASKREQGDVYNEQIATDLAMGRALIKLGTQLKRRAEKAVEVANPPQPVFINVPEQAFAAFAPEPPKRRFLARLFGRRNG